MRIRFQPIHQHVQPQIQLLAEDQEERRTRESCRVCWSLRVCLFHLDLLIYVPVFRAHHSFSNIARIFFLCSYFAPKHACPSAFATRPLYHHDPSMRLKEHSCADTYMQYRRLQER
jgi:hypothetical protein